MPTLILALMTWAAAATSLPVPTTAPDIARLEPCAIQHLVTPDSPCDPHFGAVSAYDYRHQVIYLPRDWSAANLYHVSMLLHELIHHMQTQAGLVVTRDGNPCVERTIELPAYLAQIAFLQAAGVDPYENIDPLMLELIGSCPATFE